MQLTPPPSPTLKGVCASPESRVGRTLSNGVTLTSVLGTGAYGVVYKARDRKGVACAVKALNKVGLSERQHKFARREIELHSIASEHPNVVTLLDVLDSPDCTYVILEYCDGADLFANIAEQGHFYGNDHSAKQIFLQILDAVDFCHSRGIYHRDLKPENILLTNGGSTAKLADFGLACTDTCSSDFGCGSTFYMSPECLQLSPAPFSLYASAPNDVWSLGVVLSNIVTGRNPWKKAAVEDPTFAAFLQDSEFLKSILPITDELDWILRRIFECDPSQRVTIPQLRRMIMDCSAFTTIPQSYRSARFPSATMNNQPLTPPTTTYDEPYPVHPPVYSTMSGSSGSLEEWTSAPHSPYAMAPGQSQEWVAEAFEDMTLLPPPVYQPPPRTHEVSSPSQSWYSSLMPALDFTQKHMSIQPFLPTMSMTFFN